MFAGLTPFSINRATRDVMDARFPRPCARENEHHAFGRFDGLPFARG